MSSKPHRFREKALLLAIGLASLCFPAKAGAPLLAGCSSKKPGTTEQDPEARDSVTGLTKAEENLVLAEVSGRKITLGQYAHTLRSMGKFERLRYQSPERQKELLEQMIDLELLAEEARRRGLDKKPEVVLGRLQALRDALLAEIEKELPALESFSEREVKEYYDAHASEFSEPERKRALVIVVHGAPLAEKIIAELKDAKPEKWGELAAKYSLEKRGLGKGDPPELAGDLGFVSAPGETRGENPSVPAEVRAALFELENLGAVSAKPVPVEGKYYVVRLGAESAARTRSLAEADRTIRVELRRQLFKKRESELERELAAKYPLSIDKAALAEWTKNYESKKAAPDGKKP